MTSSLGAAVADNDLDERTTAQGLFNYGDSYLGSAHALREANAKVTFPDSPVRFLLYHAAELHLKAFLKCGGFTVADLRDKGHSFTKLLPAARKLALGLDRESEAVLLFGQRTGDVIESRYIRTGFRRWYDTPALGRCAAAVRRAVRLHPARTKHILLRGERAGHVDDHWETIWGA